MAVAVEVGHEDRVRAARRVGQHVARERRRTRAVVLVPGDRVVRVAGRDHVDVAVAVEVGGEDGGRTGGKGDRDPRRERCRRPAFVAVPVDRPAGHRRRDDVETAVAVEIRGEHVVGAVGCGRDRVRGERRRVGAVVLVPGDLVVEARRGEHVEVAIAVQVGHRDGRGGVRIVGNDHRRERRRTRPVVAVPGDRIAREGGRDDVDVTVAVEIGRKRVERDRGGGRDRMSVRIERRRDGAVVLEPRHAIEAA